MSDHAPAGGIEITTAGLDLKLESGACSVGLAGGAFVARHNGKPLTWPGRIDLKADDTLAITPGPSGNYGYLRFDCRFGRAGNSRQHLDQ